MEPSRLSPQDLPQTDTLLLQAAREQEQDAWRELIFLYAPIIRYWIMREGVRTRADTEDIFQDVCLGVSKSLPQFRRESGKAKFRAWLKSITHNKVVDHWRKRERQSPGQGGTTAMRRIEEVAAEWNDESQILISDSNAEQSIVLQRALYVIRQEFQDSSWQAFEKTAIDGLSATEAAELLGSTSAAVRKAKSRVLSRLRELLNAAECEIAVK